jgi:hypothetical protein
MAYKGIDDIQNAAAEGAKGLLSAFEMIENLEKTLPLNQRHEIQKLKNKHSGVFEEAKEAIKNVNLDTSTW